MIKSQKMGGVDLRQIITLYSSGAANVISGIFSAMSAKKCVNSPPSIPPRLQRKPNTRPYVLSTPYMDRLSMSFDNMFAHGYYNVCDTIFDYYRSERQYRNRNKLDKVMGLVGVTKWQTVSD